VPIVLRLSEVGKPQSELTPFRDELLLLRRALGSRIRELRKLRGWSQETFADKSHIHRTFAGSLERGEKNVSFHALVLIAKCFAMPLSELLAGLEDGRTIKKTRWRPKLRSERLERDRILSEMAALEGNLRALKELVIGSDERRTETRSK